MVTPQQRPSALLSKRDDGDHLATMPVAIGALNQPSAEPFAGCEHDRRDDECEDGVTRAP